MLAAGFRRTCLNRHGRIHISPCACSVCGRILDRHAGASSLPSTGFSVAEHLMLTERR
jgi:hypothetical protein